MRCSYCGICQKEVHDGNWASPIDHMKSEHSAELRRLEQWDLLLKMPVDEVKFDSGVLGEWVDRVVEMQGQRTSEEETRLQQEGMKVLMKLLKEDADDMALLPFGSSVIGTSEKGKSDTDVSILAGMNTRCHLHGIPRGRYGRIVGEKGAERARLQDEYGVHVFVPGQGAPGPITITAPLGKDSNIKACLDSIRSLLPEQGRSIHTEIENCPADEKTVLGTMSRKLAAVLDPPCTEYLAHTKVPILRIKGAAVSARENTIICPRHEIPHAVAELTDQGLIHDAEVEGGAVTFPTMDQALEALQQLELAEIDVKLAIPRCLASEWDITARPQFGPRNSKLLREILHKGGEAALVSCCLIKRWGKQHGVSDARNGYISSYALVLMYCFYLQQVGAVEYVDHLSVAVDSLTVGLLPDAVASAELSAEDIEKVARFTIGFFRYYSMFDWSNRAVTLTAPPSTVVRPEDLNYTVPNTLGTLRYHVKDHVHCNLVVHDPYEGVNTARRIGLGKAFYVKGMINLTYRMLAGGAGGPGYQRRLSSLFDGNMTPDTEVPWGAVGLDLAEILQSGKYPRLDVGRELYLPAWAPRPQQPVQQQPGQQQQQAQQQSQQLQALPRVPLLPTHPQPPQAASPLPQVRLHPIAPPQQPPQSPQPPQFTRFNDPPSTDPPPYPVAAAAPLLSVPSTAPVRSIGIIGATAQKEPPANELDLQSLLSNLRDQDYNC